MAYNVERLRVSCWVWIGTFNGESYGTTDFTINMSRMDAGRLYFEEFRRGVDQAGSLQEVSFFINEFDDEIDCNSFCRIFNFTIITSALLILNQISPSTWFWHKLVYFEKLNSIKTFNCRNKYIERDLHNACLVRLQTSSLLKDDNITPDLMIECMKQLLKSDLKLTNLNLHVTTYYSLLNDGTICIPWNFKQN